MAFGPTIQRNGSTRLATWFSHLRLSRFTRVIRCAGPFVRAATAQHQAPRGSQTVSGILEFVPRERASLAPSIVPGHFRITARRMGDAAASSRAVTVVSATPTPTPPPMPGPPFVTTNPATLIASFPPGSMGLNPHGLTTTFHFRYGITTSYGLRLLPRVGVEIHLRMSALESAA